MQTWTRSQPGCRIRTRVNRGSSGHVGVPRLPTWCVMLWGALPRPVVYILQGTRVDGSASLVQAGLVRDDAIRVRWYDPVKGGTKKDVDCYRDLCHDRLKNQLTSSEIASAIKSSTSKLGGPSELAELMDAKDDTIGSRTRCHLARCNASTLATTTTANGSRCTTHSLPLWRGAIGCRRSLHGSFAWATHSLPPGAV